MLSKSSIFNGSKIIEASLLLISALISGCKVNEQYRIDDLKDINTDVTLFSENGIDVPLGKTEEISVDSLFSKLDENVRQYIEKNGDSYLLKLDGKFNLDEQLKSFDMSSLANIDGVKIDESVEYELNFNKDDFRIDAVEYNERIKVSADEIIDFGQQNLDFLTSFTADVSNYAPTTEQLNIAPEPITQSLNIVPAGSKPTLASGLLILAGGVETKVVDIPSEMLGSEIPVNKISASVEPVNITLDNVITKIEDVELDSEAEIDIDLKLDGCFLTEGTVNAVINVDLSKIFKIEGQGVLTLNESLSESNSYHKTVSKKITDLVYLSDGNSISVAPQADLEGTIKINGAKTSYTKFQETANKDFALALTISYKNLKVADATLTLSEIAIDDIQPAEHNLSFSCTANDLEKINYVYLDAPLSMKLELNEAIGSLAVSPSLKIDVPQGMGFKYGETEVEDGGSVQVLDGSRQLSPASPINETLYITSILPKVEGSIVSYEGSLGVVPSAKISGKLKLSDLIDKSKFKLSASIKGIATISDYSVDTKNMTVDSPSIVQYVSADLGDAGEFGPFTVIPSGSPKLQMIFKLPEVDGVNIVAGKKGFVFQLPGMFVPEESDLEGYHYDSGSNSVKILENEAFPMQMSFRVKQLDVVPEKNAEGKYEVRDSMKVYGELAIASTTITKDMIELVNKEESAIKVGLQAIEADKVILSGDLSFDLGTEEEITLLKADDLPEEVKYIKELTLSDVYATIGAEFTNLPDIGKDYGIDAKIELPPFIVPSSMDLKGKIVKNKFVTETGASTFKVKIEKLKDIDLSGNKDILGTVKIDGKISASSPEIEIETLKDKLACKLSITLGNEAGKVAIEKAIGNVEIDIPGHFAVDFGEIPEELKADDVILDLASPEIRMAVATNLGLPISGDMTITPWRNGNAMTGNAVTLGPLDLPYSYNAGVTENKDFIFGDPSMKKLLRQIPDSLVIELAAGVVEGSDCLIEPSAEYKADIDYEFGLPIDLGSETNLKLNADFEFGEVAPYLPGNKIGITGNLRNDTPLVLRARLEVLDKEGKLISEAAPQEDVVIDAEKTSELSFSLSVPETYKAEEIGKGNVVLTIGSVGGPIRPSHKLQLTDIVAHLPEGITIKTANE